MTEEPLPLSLHPECPDPSRLGPDPAQGLLRARAARVAADRAATPLDQLLALPDRLPADPAPGPGHIVKAR